MNRHESLTAHTARVSAARLSIEFGEQLPGDAEAVLSARGELDARSRYADPTSLGALIVSVSSLAWTIYHDLKAKTNPPAREEVERHVRVRIGEAGALAWPQEQQDRIVEVVVSEVVQPSEP